MDEARASDAYSLLPLLLALARRLRWLIGIPLLTGVVVFGLNVTAKPVYSATARILPPQYNSATVTAMQNQPGGESQIGNSALTLKNPTDLFVGILSSRTILDAVIEKERLAEHYGITTADDLRRKLASLTDIRAGKDGIVSVSVEDHDAQRAAELANTYVAEFYAFASGLAKQEAKLRSAFYDSALHAAQQRLAEADAALRDVEAKTGFTRLRGQDEAIVQYAAELQAQISSREVQLKTMQGYATASNPDVKLLRGEIAHLREELAKLAAAPQSQAAATSPEPPPFIGVHQVPDALMLSTARKRDVEYWESIVLVLGRYSELNKIDETRDLSLFQVLDSAVPSLRKSRPRTTVNTLLAVIGSGTVCLALALALEYVERRRRDSAEFETQWQQLRAVLRAQLAPRRRRNAP